MPEGYRDGRDNPAIEPLNHAPEEPQAVTIEPHGLLRRGLSAFADLVIRPNNPGESIYGLIVVGALFAGESGRHESYLGTIASGAIAAAVYWLAHSYSKVLGQRLVNRERLTSRALGDALIHDWPLMIGASIPLVSVIVAAIVGASQETAVSAAVWTVVASLVGFELLAGLRAKAAPKELVFEMGIGVAMGLAIVALKVVLH